MLQLENSRAARPVALLLCSAIVLPQVLAGCDGGSSEPTASAPPPPTMSNNRPVAQPKQGMSTTKKAVVALAGAAALYYLYKKHQAAKTTTGAEGKYFISESTGRVYYRNLKTGEFQWVSPPNQAIQVPADQAREYSQYSGYNNQNNGKSFGGYGPGQESYNDTVPASLIVR